jgi:hypothetical protein
MNLQLYRNMQRGPDIAYARELSRLSPANCRGLLLSSGASSLCAHRSEILQLIRAIELGVTISIVGRAPTPMVRRLGALSGE